MTRDELLAKLALTRARKIDLTWGQFTALFASLPPAEKAQLLGMANKGDGRGVFTIIYGLVTAEKLKIARADVDLAAANDQLSIDELIALLS